MLQREDELRKAPETQAAMQRAEESVDMEWMDVVEAIQLRVVKEFCEAQDVSSVNISVLELRAAALRHPEVAHWVKFNRARRGDLVVGSQAPNVHLRQAMGGKSTYLLDRKLDNSERTVVIAGSLS